MREFSESKGVPTAVDVSEIDALPGGPAVVGGGGFEALRGRPVGGDWIASSPFLSTPARNAAAELVGLSSSLLFFSLRSLILLRIDPLRDREDPWVSVLMIGKVLVPSTPSEPVEARAERLPLSPDLFDGCWPMLE
jgi:hypothetical protein